MELNRLLEGAKEGNQTVFLEMKKEYLPQVRAIAQEVLKEKDEAELSAELTLKNVYKLLGNGVNPGVLEPWMNWLAREDALEILRRRRDLIRQERLLEQGNLLDSFDEMDPSVYFANPEEWKLLSEAAESTAQKKEEPVQEEKAEEAVSDAEKAQKEQAEELTAELQETEGAAEEQTISAEQELTPESAAEVNYIEGVLFEKPKDQVVEAARVVAESVAAEEKASRETAEDTDAKEEKKKDGFFAKLGKVLLTITLTVLVIALLWAILGLVRTNMGLQDMIPDLGYWWVNEYIYPLF